MLYLKAVNWEDIEKEYLYVTSLPADENGFTNPNAGVSREDFEKIVLPRFINHSKGIDLPNGYVSCTEFFLWDDDEIVGLIILAPCVEIGHHAIDRVEG